MSMMTLYGQLSWLTINLQGWSNTGMEPSGGRYGRPAYPYTPIAATLAKTNHIPSHSNKTIQLKVFVKLTPSFIRSLSLSLSLSHSHRYSSSSSPNLSFLCRHACHHSSLSFMSKIKKIWFRPFFKLKIYQKYEKTENKEKNIRISLEELYFH